MRGDSLRRASRDLMRSDGHMRRRRVDAITWQICFGIAACLSNDKRGSSLCPKLLRTRPAGHVQPGNERLPGTRRVQRQGHCLAVVQVCRVLSGKKKDSKQCDEYLCHGAKKSRVIYGAHFRDKVGCQRWHVRLERRVDSSLAQDAILESGTLDD